MAVIDDTRIIVQALADTYEAIHEAFADQPGADVSDDQSPVLLKDF